MLSVLETWGETRIRRQIWLDWHADFQGSSSPFQEVQYRAGWAHRKYIGHVLVSKPSGQALWTHVRGTVTN